MRDSFDYATYWTLLSRISARHRIARFADFADGRDVEEPFCILRHDVDYSPRAALRLAEQEAARGIRATYFLLAGTGYYNLLAPEHAHVARTIAGLGHEVGLHYDINSFSPFPRDEWLRLLRAQAALLGELAGQPVVSVAMHQPALNGSDPFHNMDRAELGFLNAYDERFTSDTTYVSDSCRAWRNSGWEMLMEGAFPRRLHLCLHPINLAEADRDRLTIFRDVHEELVTQLTTLRDELLAKIDCHAAVLEHEARSREVV